MKPTSLYGKALVLALLAAPLAGQILTLDPTLPNSGIVSSNGPAFDNGLNVQLTFNFGYELIANSNSYQMSVTIWNQGNPLAPNDWYNISQFGFNAPPAWGDVSLDLVNPLNHSHTGGISTLGTEPNFFGGYSFSTWVGSANGSGSTDKLGELGIDVGEMTELVFGFSTPDTLNFNLTAFLAGNGLLPDLGLRIQPMSISPGSDKWVYTRTSPPDIPPPSGVPEPSTYAWGGALSLMALGLARRLRQGRNKAA